MQSDSEDDSSEDEDWDEAHRISEDRNAVAQQPLRALCPDCQRPLRRVASIPYKAMCLGCAQQQSCARCNEEIPTGDMNFMCRSCDDVRVCRACGPNAYVERQYDFYDGNTKDVQIIPIPNVVLHKRRTRSVQLLQDDGVPDSVKAQAKAIVGRVADLSRRVSQEDNIRDADWTDASTLPYLLGLETSGGSMGSRSPEAQAAAQQSVVDLAEAAIKIFERQPVMTHASIPCKVFGDTHGQLRDLLLYFQVFGAPCAQGGQDFVFNGDFVDRGAHQLEVLVVLLALKVTFPERVWMNRGNHEDATMSKKYGFDTDVYLKLPGPGSKYVFQALARCFEMMPLACLIDKRVLVVHGGLGKGKWKLKDFETVQRPLSHQDLQKPANNWLWNILWSDPIEDDDGKNVFGLHSSGRKCSTLTLRFGWDVTQAFCAMNGLDLVIRSHQSKRGGLGFDVMHNNMLIRVFSARDYESNSNDGAVLQLAYAEAPDDNGHEAEERSPLVQRPNQCGLLTVRAQVIGSIQKK